VQTGKLARRTPPDLFLSLSLTLHLNLTLHLTLNLTLHLTLNLTLNLTLDLTLDLIRGLDPDLILTLDLIRGLDPDLILTLHLIRGLDPDLILDPIPDPDLTLGLGKVTANHPRLRRSSRVARRAARGCNMPRARVLFSQAARHDGFVETTWWECQRPFQHYRAFDVLRPADYTNAAEAFRALLSGSPSIESHRPGFSRGNSKYDAQILAMDLALSQSFRPLLDTPWLESIAALLQLPFHLVVDAALHSSPANSRTGWIHTDFCAVWIDESRQETGLRFPDRRMCEYFSGVQTHRDAQPVKYARAATLIYYLCNDGWVTGAGGETALYSASSDACLAEEYLISPINNSLLLFECTPHSYHRFVSNPGMRRNSVICWLHTPFECTMARWGTTLHRGSPER
jgi:hypothetical protein